MSFSVRFLSCAALLLALAACQTDGDYPEGIRTNLVLGAAVEKTDYPGATGANAAGEAGSLLRTQEDTDGHQSICVGAWCSCLSE